VKARAKFIISPRKKEGEKKKKKKKKSEERERESLLRREAAARRERETVSERTQQNTRKLVRLETVERALSSKAHTHAKNFSE